MDNIQNKDLIAEKAKILLKIKVLLSLGRVEECIVLQKELNKLKKQ